METARSLRVFPACLLATEVYIGYFVDDGYGVFFWSSTESNSGSAHNMELAYSKDDANLYDITKTTGFSVRCLRD